MKYYRATQLKNSLEVTADEEGLLKLAKFMADSDREILFAERELQLSPNDLASIGFAMWDKRISNKDIGKFYGLYFNQLFPKEN